MGVSASAFYAWLKRPEATDKARRKAALETKARELFDDHRHTYGYRRLSDALGKARPEATAEELQGILYDVGRAIPRYQDPNAKGATPEKPGVSSAWFNAIYAVLLGDTQHDDAREQQYALMLQRREADGLIFLGHRLPNLGGSERLGQQAVTLRGHRRLEVARHEHDLEPGPALAQP